VALQARKLDVQVAWAQELERNLAAQNRRFDKPLTGAALPAQPPTRLTSPIHFSIELTHMVTRLIDLYSTMIGQSPFRYAERARDIVGQLRRSGDLPPFLCTYSRAAALAVCAAFVNSLECIRAIMRRVQTRLLIPSRCGLTNPEFHGSEKLLHIVATAIYRQKPEEGSREIAGLFPEITLPHAFDIVRLGALVVLYVPLMCPPGEELELVCCHLSDGLLKLVWEHDHNTTIVLDLKVLARGLDSN
jgi:hypothetical protein